MICKQQCPRHYLQTGVISPVPKLLTLNSGSANIVEFHFFAVLEWESLFMVAL